MGYHKFSAHRSVRFLSSGAKIANDTVSLISSSGEPSVSIAREAASCRRIENDSTVFSVDRTHCQSFAGQNLLVDAARKQMDLSWMLQALDESEPSQLGAPCIMSRNVLQSRVTHSVERLGFR